jgi:hypothetical protein
MTTNPTQAQRDLVLRIMAYGQDLGEQDLKHNAYKDAFDKILNEQSKALADHVAEEVAKALKALESKLVSLKYPEKVYAGHGDYFVDSSAVDYNKVIDDVLAAVKQTPPKEGGE